MSHETRVFLICCVCFGAVHLVAVALVMWFEGWAGLEARPLYPAYAIPQGVFALWLLMRGR